MQLLALVCEAQAGKAQAVSHVRIETMLEQGQAVVRIAAGDAHALLHEQTQRTVLLARASLKPLGATLAFAQDAQGGAQLKLALPLSANQTPPS
jgi:hypothetical protein